jgi:4-hydroxy-tetrahydrodipicolinate synthase
LLSVCPYYSKPSQVGIYEHYKAVANTSPLPVIMYNVPGRTGINMTAETTVKLAHDFKNIIAMKEASGNMTQIMDIIRSKPKDFLLISGDDMLTLPIIAAGGDGIISVAANVCPREFSDMVRYALSYNMIEAQKLHYKIFDLMVQLFADCSPSGAKAALHIKGLISNTLRLPLVPVNEAVYKKLAELLKKL